MIRRFLKPNMVRESSQTITNALMAFCDTPEYLRLRDSSPGGSSPKLSRDQLYNSIYEGIIYTHLFFMQDELANASRLYRKFDKTLGIAGSKSSISRAFEEAGPALVDQETVAIIWNTLAFRLLQSEYRNYAVMLSRFYTGSAEWDQEWGYHSYQVAFGELINKYGGCNFGVQDYLIKRTGIRDFDIKLFGQYAAYWSQLRIELMDYLSHMGNEMMYEVAARRRG